MKHHFETLGLKEAASQKEIQTAYERLSKELDPKTNANQEFFVEEYQKVQEAYKALSNSSILATEKGARIATKEKYSTNSPPKNQSNTPPKKSDRRPFKKTGIILFTLVLIAAGIISYLLLQPEVFLNKDTITVKGITKTKKDLRAITGVIEGIGAYRNGIKEGQHKILHDSLQVLIAQGKYKNGKKQGLWQYYYDNGQLKKEVHYDADLKEGTFQFWNTKTVLIAERNYSSDTLTGLNKSWLDNGQLRQVSDYDTDFTQVFNEEGNLSYEGSFIKVASEWSSKTYQNTRSSLSTGPLEPNVKWRYKTGDGVTSSPSVSGGLVFVGSKDDYIYALDQYTGELKWKYKTGAGVYSSPSVSDGLVFVGSFDNYIYALDQYTGELKWRYKTGDTVTSSPSVSGGLVFVGSFDNYIYALDQYTGELQWRYKTGDGVLSSPSVSGGLVFVGSHDNYIYAFGD